MQLMAKLLRIFIILLTLSCPAAFANSPSDTLRSYRLGEIVTTSQRGQKAISTSNTYDVEYYEIQKIDAASVSELAGLLPSGAVRQNSRGESILYLRGSGERQLVIFFDGALLNVPWDNRVDLSMIPTDIIGKISASGTAGSILYGANVLGGAVNITSSEKSNAGYGGILRVQAGEANSQLYSLTHDGRSGKFNYLANVSYTKSDGAILSGRSFDLLNQDMESGIRTNTDFRRLSAYARAEYEIGSTTLGISINHIDAQKGIAPEGHRPSDNARFWRYPDWRRTMIILNGRQRFNGNRMLLKSTLWYDGFGQTIDEYEDKSYSNISKSQIDDIQTFGGRVSMNLLIEDNQSVTIASSAYRTSNDEKIISAAGGNSLEFEQITYSMGGEYSLIINDFTYSLGATYDGNRTPKAGEFTGSEGSSINDFGLMAGLKYNIAAGANCFVNISRKTRFPTLREAYPESLGRFVINENLKAENGILSEAGIEYTSEKLSTGFTIFSNFYNDMIAKQAAPNSPGKETRVNIGTAIVAGAEINSSYDLLSNLNISGNFTYLYSEGKEGDKPIRLAYRPEYFGFLIARYSLEIGVRMQVEFDFTGKQYGLNAETKAMERVCPSAAMNLRLSYFHIFINEMPTEFFIRANNLLDNYRLSKIGLPGPGRTLRAGILTHI